jgi:superfamily II DNA or RNA helicase
LKPGTIVQVRNRYWVLLPHDDPDIYLLRPLTGVTDEAVALHKRLTELLGYTLPEERPRPATFPLPAAEDVADAASAHLLWQAARLTLREGASPLRSLGKISIRPRTYQFVPLLMALRLDPVRMLIADDVGVGKTIEALLIARELWERGEIKRLAVLCPPYLCDQWQQELREKFNFHDAVVIRSGTVRALERAKPPSHTIYEHYPVQVISIDFIKSEHNRHAFLLHAPELIIADEAHGAAMAKNQSQQQRHEFLRKVAEEPNRHLILLTATPHSGVESAFQSLLGLLDPRFAEWELHDLSENRLRELARHFVQRTRKDIESGWESEPCFPTRLSADRAYRLSPAYRELFEKTYAFCAEIVRTGQNLQERQRRVRYWGALALLRCVMSSPAAALAALEARSARARERESMRVGEEERAEDEVDFRGFVFESDQQETDDEQPLPPIEAAESDLPESEQRKLRALGRLAARLQEAGQDTKLEGLVQVVNELLAEGYAPIVWCRYVATAEYVANALQKRLSQTYPGLQVACVTGRQGDEERRAHIDEIDADRPRVLVATDCLSEGINLQEKFTAVIHYDLPWNPNRLEQREGRVDRYGQSARTVKVVRYFGQDNPVDGVVVNVLLDKARQIYQALGTHVPVPEESESVTEAVLNALFLRGGYQREARQLAFEFEPDKVADLHTRWERDAERERITRSRFAQRALKPEEVQRELEAADAVLGDPDAVREFVLAAAQRLGLIIEREKRAANVYRLVTSPLPPALPDAVRFALPERKDGMWRVSFVSPTPEGAEYLGRNHPFVQALARYLFEAALVGHDPRPARRAGAIATRAVSQLTVLLLLRVRYLLQFPDAAPLFAEEVLPLAFTRAADGSPQWLPEADALRLLSEARPDANLPLERKKQVVKASLNAYPALENDLRAHLQARARRLEEAHKRIRQAVRLRSADLTLAPQFPPDLLGVLVLESVSERA